MAIFHSCAVLETLIVDNMPKSEYGLVELEFVQRTLDCLRSNHGNRLLGPLGRAVLFLPTSSFDDGRDLIARKNIPSSRQLILRSRLNPLTRHLSAYRFPLGSSEFTQFKHFALTHIIELTNGRNSSADGMQTNTSRCGSFQVNSEQRSMPILESIESNPNGTSFGCLSHVIHSYDNQMAENKTETKNCEVTTWKRRKNAQESFGRTQIICIRMKKKTTNHKNDGP